LPATAVLLLVVGALAGCSPSKASDDGRTSVVASFYPLAEAAAEAGGDLASVQDLTPAGVEPHDLELAPDDIEAIATADVVIYLGGGFQPAVQDAVTQDAQGITVDALDAVDTHPVSQSEAAEGLTVDPHVWLDPARYEQIVRAVADGLAEADPSNADTYRSNANAYVDELSALDRGFRSGLSNCERSTIVTSHEAFGYLTEAYGLKQVAIAGLSPEAEPDPRRLAEIRDLVRQQGITTIFSEELVSPKVAETLANEAGVSVQALNPLESLTDDQAQSGEDYLSIMRENLDTLRSALGCA
jgi:zinc transport system substrate-binding protein